MLQIYFADAEALRDPARFVAAYARVSASRRAKADRLRAEGPRRLALAAGALLDEALTAAGVAPEERETREGLYGKPFLPCRPDVQFSLSHSGTQVMCVLSERPVGCDIQKVSPCSLRLAERFFTAEEQECIFSQATEEARQDMFYRIWALKESFVKCLGLGLALPLTSFSCCPAENGKILLTQSESHGAFFLKELDGPPGYRCAVCIRR